MSFTPDLPFEKSRGNLIRSKDWNDAIHEIQRLDTAKVNRANDTIPGPLTISGALTVSAPGVLNFGAQVRQMINLWSSNYGIGVQNWTQYFRTDKNFAWYKNGSHNDGELNDGGGTVQMVIKDGSVGIGTSSPQAKLQVSGGAIMPSAGNGEQFGIQFPPDPGGGAYDRAWMRYYARSGEAMTLEIGIANDANDHIALISSGNVGIGTNNPTSKLHVVGSACKTDGGTAWTICSDMRLKQNIGPLRGALNKLLQLCGVTFEWKEPEQHGDLIGTQMGMVAQEVEEVFPEWVNESSDGLKYLSIRGFEALVVEAFRDLNARVSTLETTRE